MGGTAELIRPIGIQFPMGFFLFSKATRNDLLNVFVRPEF